MPHANGSIDELINYGTGVGIGVRWRDLPAPLQPQVEDMLSDPLMSAKVCSTAEIKPSLTGVTIPMTSDALIQGNNQIRQCHDNSIQLWMCQMPELKMASDTSTTLFHPPTLPSSHPTKEPFPDSPPASQQGRPSLTALS